MWLAPRWRLIPCLANTATQPEPPCGRAREQVPVTLINSGKRGRPMKRALSSFNIAKEMLTLVPNTTAHFGLHIESWRMHIMEYH